MTGLQVDAASSFVYLTDNVPNWLTQLNDLSKYAAQKHREFIGEDTRPVDNVNPKRIKSPSLQSIHSDKSQLAQVPDIAPQTDLVLPTPPNLIDIGPVEAVNKYSCVQAERKRKPTSSLRSGASGPRKFRSKSQAVIYYDSHIQIELDSMVKAIGLARNYLRKGRNAINAFQGFSLPSIGKRNVISTPCLGDLGTNAMSRSNLGISGSKYMLRSSSQQAANGDDALFVTADKVLESVQALCETAAHQFLRDGDCKTELDSATSKLSFVLAEAQQAADTLRRRIESQKELQAESDESVPNGISTISRLQSPTAFDPLQRLHNKYGATSLSQTLEDMRNRPIYNTSRMPAGGGISSLPTVGVEIEVDTDEDGASIDEVIDLSQFRAGNRARVTRAH